MHRLIDIKFLDGYKIHLFFEDGYNSEIDFEPFLQKGFARELLNKATFNQAYIESGGGLAWNNGFDFCTNFLYEISTKKTLERA
ncbi:MAG: hypothetical protein JWQ09_1176 [Segetibacter sp.]|nr:hypothetical protein [Segetibacter sp.]